MTIPDYQSLMLPVLVASSKGEVSIRAVIERLADQLGLSPEERSELLLSGKQTVFSNRVHWAKTYLAQAGLIENTRRGHFAITPRGEQTLASGPSHIDNAFLSQFNEFKQFKERARVSQPKSSDVRAEAEETNLHNEIETPDEIMRRAHKQINTALAKDLLDRVCAAAPEFFERLIVDLLLSMGYGGSRADKAGRALGRSGDDGVDGVIDQDALGLDRIYIQAKRYAAGNNIGSGAIRDFFGSLDRHKASKGLFVTTSAFSPSAKETAEFLSKRIVLIDGDQLAALMVQQNIGCRIEDTINIKKIDEEFFEP
ncbi:MAG TPA: restriction endonuclease [Bryobacteraceae bacterium]